MWQAALICIVLCQTVVSKGVPKPAQPVSLLQDCECTGQSNENGEGDSCRNWREGGMFCYCSSDCRDAERSGLLRGAFFCEDCRDLPQAGRTPSVPAPPSPTGINRINLRERNSLLLFFEIWTDEIVDIYVEYGPRSGSSDAPWLRSPISRSSDFHEVFLYRLYEDTDYDFRVFLDGVEFDRGSFTTGGANRDVTSRNPTVEFGRPTYDLVYTGRDSPDMHYAFDSKGNIVYYMDKRGFPGDAVEVKSNHHIGLLSLRGPYVEVHPNGETIQEIDVRCNFLHHSMTLQANDERYVWTFGKELKEFSGIFRPQAVDVVYKLDTEAGTYDMEIDMSDILNIYTDRSAFSDQVGDPEELFPCVDDHDDPVNDWIRTNSIFSVTENYVLVGSHHLETIFGIKRASNTSSWKLDWRITHDPMLSDFRFSTPSARFHGQHEGQLMPNGNLLIMDNGIGRPIEEGGWFSRGLELELDFDEMVASQVWEGKLDLDRFLDIDDWPTIETPPPPSPSPPAPPSPGDAPPTPPTPPDNSCDDWRGGFCTAGHRGTTQRLQNGNTVVLFSDCDCDPSFRGYLAEFDPRGNMVSVMSQNRHESFLWDYQVIDSIGGEKIIS